MTRPRISTVLVLLAAFSLWSGFDLFQTRSDAVEEGNRLLRAGKLKEALKAYERAAKELPDEPGVQYNLGIAQHRLGQFEKARQALGRATVAQSRELRRNAFYNLGNAQFELKRYKEAVGAYTRALQLDPGHGSARWNLELALRRLQEEEKKKKEEEKKQQQKKQQKKDPKQNQDQKNQDQKNQDQKNQDQKQGADQKRPSDKKQDKKDPGQDKKQAQKQQQKKQQEKRDGAKAGQKPPEMDNVLDALDRNDRNLQRRRARMQPGGGLTRPSKDW
jgi:tetratricopeptide (TPR) repeat protein